MKDIVILDGWWGSGKSTLRGVLDGHPELMVCPVQDSICGGCSLQSKWSQIMESKDLGEFRKTLWGYTDYYRVEQHASSGNLSNLSGAKQADITPFVFSFTRFDQTFSEQLRMADVWSLDVLLDLYYSLFSENWSHTRQDVPRIAVTMDNNYPMTSDFLLKNSSRTKFIWVDRPSEDILAVHVKRKPVDGQIGTRGWGKMSISSLIRSGYVFEHERRREKVKRLAGQHPDRVQIITLRELVEKTAETVHKVTDFIGMAPHPILESFTYMGQPFPGSEHYLERLNDLGENVFSKAERDQISREVIRSQKGLASPFIQMRALRSSVGNAIRTYRGFCSGC